VSDSAVDYFFAFFSSHFRSDTNKLLSGLVRSVGRSCFCFVFGTRIVRHSASCIEVECFSLIYNVERYVVGSHEF